MEMEKQIRNFDYNFIYYMTTLEKHCKDPQENDVFS